jgi:hypothetical protein
MYRRCHEREAPARCSSSKALCNVLGRSSGLVTVGSLSERHLTCMISSARNSRKSKVYMRKTEVRAIDIVLSDVINHDANQGIGATRPKSHSRSAATIKPKS